MKTTVRLIDQDKRLDVFVAEKLPELSRSAVSKLIVSGKVLVNKEAEKPGHRLKKGDKVAIDFDASELAPEVIDLPVLYEDENCLVINKPAGVLTHSKGIFNPEGTVATFVASKVSGMDGERAGIVHRLDRATSGVLIAAKNPEALSWFQKQFAQRRVKKTYVAIIPGTLQPPAALIDVPIERNPKKPQTFRAHIGGKPSQTAYTTLEDNERYSFVELRPQTGRTHQLRVHLNYIGHPIVGDDLYGGEKADRLYLHAHKLELTLPNKERKTFISPIPREFRAIMK